MSSLFRIAAAVAAFACAATASRAQAMNYPEHYAYDPAYNGGAVLDDSFDAAGPHIGQKAAQLADGSVVVVGLATASGQASANNLGLVHYSATGARIAWSDPTPAYASYYNMYLTYPNGQFTAAYSRIDDVKVLGHFIYVLSDNGTSASAARYPTIDVFSDSGQRIIGYSPFGFFNGDIEGAGLAINSYTINFGGSNVTFANLAVATNDNTGTASQPDYVVVMHLYPLNADGTLGTAYTSFGTNGTATFDLSGYCSGTTICSGPAAGVAAVRTDTNKPTYYVYGTLTSGNASDLPSGFIQAVDVEGEDVGLQWVPMDTAGDRAFGLVAVGNALGDTLYFGMGSALSSEGCLAYGSTIRKIHNGQITWYGTYGCDPQSGLAIVGKSLVSDGTRLMIAGYAHYITFSGSPTYYPGIATISQTNGEVLDVQMLPWMRADGTTWSGTADGRTLDHTSDFESVVPVAAGKFVVAGTLCDHLHGTDNSIDSTCRAFGTTQLVSDAIFMDGFDGD